MSVGLEDPDDDTNSILKDPARGFYNLFFDFKSKLMKIIVKHF